MTSETIFILGAGFSKSISRCIINNKKLRMPVDRNFFNKLREDHVLNNLLSDKPCLVHMLSWMKIYDKDADKLIQTNFSMERFWTEINLLLKLNSSISGFPGFGILDSLEEKSDTNDLKFIPNLDDWKKEMFTEEKDLYEYLSDTKVGNFFNPEGLILYLADYELKKLILDVYDNSDYQDNIGLVDKFKNLAKECTLITFNYDCLVETIFENHSLFNYDQRIELEDNINLIIKPHGSLGWVVTKKYSKEDGVITVIKRTINRKVLSNNFSTVNSDNNELEVNFPIMIPMCPGKENFISSLDSNKIRICSNNDFNKTREFIDCVVGYAKMLEAIRDAKRIVFIGYSFPSTDYETVALINFALKTFPEKECHICVKEDGFYKYNLDSKKIIYYRGGLEQFVKEFS